MASWPRDSRSDTPSSDENELPGTFLTRMKAHAIASATKATPANLEKRHSQSLHCVFLTYAWPSFASTSSSSRPWLSSRSIESAGSCSSRIVGRLLSCEKHLCVAVKVENSGSSTPNYVVIHGQILCVGLKAEVPESLNTTYERGKWSCASPLYLSTGAKTGASSTWHYLPHYEAYWYSAGRTPICRLLRQHQRVSITL
jgi:hypothetical protein